MAARPKPPVFLARTSYRQRRLRDAARLLPVLGATLWMLPLLWPRASYTDADMAQSTSTALIYIFGVWSALILGGFVLSQVLRPDDEAGAAPGSASGGTGAALVPTGGAVRAGPRAAGGTGGARAGGGEGARGAGGTPPGGTGAATGAGGADDAGTGASGGTGEAATRRDTGRDTGRDGD